VKKREVILECERCGKKIPAYPGQQIFHGDCLKKSVRGALPEYKEPK